MQNSMPLRNSRGSSLERGISPHGGSNPLDLVNDSRLNHLHYLIGSDTKRERERTSSSHMQHITPLRYKSRSGERHSSNSPAAHNILHSHHELMQSIYTTGQDLPRYTLPAYPISPDKRGYGSQGGVRPTIASHDALLDPKMRDSL